MRLVRSHLLPFRVFPLRRFPALSSLPGHMPAQLARWPAVGNTAMSVPISARMVSAVRRWTPGDRHQALDLRGERAELLRDVGANGGDRVLEVVEVGEDLAEQERMVG